jgi:hypothetical protein
MRGAAILFVGLFCTGCGQVADAQAKLVDTLRVKEAIGDYEKADTSGNLLDACVKAKFVSTAYSDARDFADSQAWLARSQEDCRLAAQKLRAAMPPAEP